MATTDPRRLAAPGDPPAGDRRQRRAQATREAIRTAAFELVAEHGLGAVSVEMIAERADVGYRTFFNHFASKEDALVEPAGPRAARLAALIDARPAAESPLEALRAAATAELEAVESRRVDGQVRWAVIEDNPELMVRFQSQFLVLERAVAEAVARRCGLDAEESLYPGLVAAVTGTAMRACLTRWRHRGGRESLFPLLAQAFDTLAAGLTPPPPRPPIGA